VKFTWQGEQVTRRAVSAFQDAARILDRRINMAITDPIWNWPNSPSPRDIVDTGQLRQSQQPVQFTTPTTAVYRNSAEYALAVHEGYTTREGFTGPPRRFMVEPLEAFDFPSAFASLYRSTP
jgi:hypothetical protein